MALMLIMSALTFMSDHDADNDTDDDTDDDTNEDTDDDTDDGGRGNRRPLPAGAVHFSPPPQVPPQISGIWIPFGRGKGRG